MDRIEYQPSQVAQQPIEQLVLNGRLAEVTMSQSSDDNLSKLNTSRLILDTVGADVLKDIAEDYLCLLQTSSAIYEKNGDYALRILSSDWCRFLDLAARNLCATDDNRVALTCGKWLFHEASWRQACLPAIETGQAVDIDCQNGLRLYAVPIFAGEEIIGSINFSYGDPPLDPQKLTEIAELYGVSSEELTLYANSYQSRPDFIIEASKKRLQTSAKLIGEIVKRQQIERENAQLLIREHTARAQAQAAQQNIINILESISDGFYALDNEWRYTYINTAAEPFINLMNRKREDLIGKNIWVEFPEAVDTNFAQKYHQAIAQQEKIEFEEFYPPLNRWFQINAYPSPTGLSIYFQDITQRKQTEERLNLAQQELAAQLALIDAFFESAPLGLAFYDRQLRWVRINKYLAHINGISPEAHLGRTVEDILPSKLAAKVDLILRRILETKQPVLNVELRGETYAKPDQTRYWLANYYPVNAKNGEILGIGVAILEITDLKQAQDAVRESEERLRLSLNAGRMGIWDWNIVTGEVKWSDNLEEIHGMSPGSFASSFASFQNIIHLEDREYVNQAITRAVEEGTSYDIEFRVIAEDGSIQWIMGKGQPFCDDTGKAVRMIGVGANITARKQVEAALLSKSEELEQANRIKDDFLAVLSHELRSPLNAILGWSTLLRTRQFDRAGTDRALEVIERNAKLQTQLIEDLLDVSRIIQGKLNIVPSPINLVSIIEASIDTTRLAAEAKSINVTFLIENSGVRIQESEFKRQEYKYAPPLPHSATSSPLFLVMGDANRLQQVVWNLLTNAIKFTSNGGNVEIRLSVVKGTGNGEQGTEGAEGVGERGRKCHAQQSTVTSHQSTVNSQQSTVTSQQSTVISHQSPVTQYAQIQVIDTGKGISSDFLPYVFDRFRQADGSTTRSQTGLGLGLAIARHLVELHGGTISADSIGEGQGATFTVLLPLLFVEKEAKENVNLSSQSIHPSTRRLLDGLQILLVDDDADVRFFLYTLLKQHGAIVTQIASATEALTKLSQLQLDILLSDIGMPEIDGYEFIHKVRSHEIKAVAQIPAIALTAYAREEDRSIAIEAGFQVHLTKPVDPELLISAIAQLTKRSQ